MFKNLSAKDIKEIILTGKDANCASIVYNGLHITYKEASAPSESSWPLPPVNIPLTEQDNLTKNETTGEDANFLSADLQYKLHEDPVAFEEALAGAEWTRKIIKSTK